MFKLPRNRQQPGQRWALPQLLVPMLLRFPKSPLAFRFRSRTCMCVRLCVRVRACV